MVERHMIVDAFPLSYTGIFSIRELFEEIRAWRKEMGYDHRKDLSHDETITESGKNVTAQFEIIKQLTEYAWRILVIDIRITGAKDIDVEKAGIIRKLDHGKLELKITGYYQTDLENKWEMKPAYMVIKSILDKYLLRPATSAPEGAVGGDVSSLHLRLKAFLNLFRY